MKRFKGPLLELAGYVLITWAALGVNFHLGLFAAGVFAWSYGVKE